MQDSEHTNGSSEVRESVQAPKKNPPKQTTTACALKREREGRKAG